MEISISKPDWDDRLMQLLSSYDLVAPVEKQSHLDYAQIGADNISQIVYNRPKPVTPLKTFLLPVKENVTAGSMNDKDLVILGPPSCDISALALLDAIYKEAGFPDLSYIRRREHTTLVSMDCHSIEEHCHCTTYDVEPWANAAADISVALADGQLLIRTHSPKGDKLLDSMGIVVAETPDKELLDILKEKQLKVKAELKKQNESLPGYEETGKLVEKAPDEIWKKYASGCVSCGACSAICPTCSCFLLLEKPGFEKVRQLDTCQYPGFERVAGGEDPLHVLPERFRNRYMCKYVWKPDNYSLKACTGCGRCTETCIGQINKNELIMALSN